MDFGSFVLMWLFVAMAGNEPMLYCMNSNYFPTSDCPESDGDLSWWYSVFSMVAMALHWLLLIDLAVFSTKMSAFCLVLNTVFGEVGRFFIALAFLLLTFSSAIACLCRDHPDWKDMPNSVFSLTAITLLMMPRDYRELQHDPVLLIAVYFFVVATVILLLNLLVAQVNCAYESVYQDMLGFARLNRADVIVATLNTCSSARWQKFCRSLKFDRRVEFNEGDIGLPGALQLNEPASVNPITIDQITRYGGTCSPEMRWPQDKSSMSKDRFDHMESLARKALRRVTKASHDRSGTGTGGGSGSGGGGGASGSDMGESSSESEGPGQVGGPRRQLSGSSTASLCNLFSISFHHLHRSDGGTSFISLFCEAAYAYLSAPWHITGG